MIDRTPARVIAQKLGPRDDPGRALADLSARIVAAPDMDGEAMARVHDGIVDAVVLIQSEQDWRTSAHVHAVPHEPIVTLDVAPDVLAAYLADPQMHPAKSKHAPVPIPPNEIFGEEVDASGVICHDCGRYLVNDRGSERLLVCPRLHGRRPPELRPTSPSGAVECGRDRDGRTIPR